MQDDVNTPAPLPSLRQVQIAHTEQRIMAAATELFLADGYVATTLEAVAKRAQVGARTVYVRFGTKAALFKRVVDVAVVGDTLPIPVLERDWARNAGTAPTAAERIAASAAICRQIAERAGPLFVVAQQAAAIEPLIAGFWQQGREQSRQAQAEFWSRMANDGLVDPAADLAWIIDTAAIVGAAETYLLIWRMLGWDLDAYENWLVTAFTMIATASSGWTPPAPALPPPP
jgi:AcrR family transcriptional regulator